MKRAAGGARLLLAFALAWGAMTAVAADLGESIYRQALGRGGQPVQAQRSVDGALQASAAACLNCHQRSGLGGREGRITVPPITGRYLFRPRLHDGQAEPVPFVEGMRGDRDPYDDTTLARAIREGVDVQGRVLGDVMPRYALTDAEMAALIGYLRQLDPKRTPGVAEGTLHFATIVTPDADPRRREAMLSVMRQFVADHNVRQMEPVPALRSSGRTAYAKSMFMVRRRWELHVWELTGPESGWGAQLDRRLAEEPVFAVLSGLAGRSWAPVHQFCERQQLPCVFPNVDAPPPEADRDFYSLYYSRGVLLEADLLAQALAEAPPARVLQVWRDGDAGEAGAAALASALAATPGPKPVVRGVSLPRAAPPSAVADALRGAAEDTALVLWLRPPDLAALPAQPPAAKSVHLSGRLGGLEQAPLPPAWRAAALLAYPVDLPEKRRVRVDYARGWMAARRLPVVDEAVQSDTYLALGLVAETLGHMTDVFVRDYLVERLQNTLDHRIITGYYPRLSLAPGQRFASKGARLVRFAQASGTQLTPQTDWLVP